MNLCQNSEEIGKNQGTKKMHRAHINVSHKTKSSKILIYSINGHHNWNFGPAKQEREVA
jgi:hypothetical protein